MTTFISKTYNTSIKAEKGDLLKVSFVDISKYIDPKTGKVFFNLWAPHVIAKVNKRKTTSISTLEKLVQKTTGRVQYKTYPKEPEKYHPETAKGFSECISENIEPIPFSDFAEEVKPFSFSDKYIFVAFSGGKDSSAALTLLKKNESFPGQVQAIYVDSPSEFPGLKENAIAVCKKLGVKLHLIKGKDLFSIIASHDYKPPSAKAPYCSREMKLLPVKEFLNSLNIPREKIILAIGTRHSESLRRRNLNLPKYGYLSFFRTYVTYPVADWSEEKVFSYLRENNIPISPLYNYLSRTGCYACPFANKEHWLYLRDHHPDLLKQVLDFEKKHNFPFWSLSHDQKVYLSNMFKFWDSHLKKIPEDWIIKAEKKSFAKSKKWVLQAHIRLGTCHGDFRYAPDHFLKGFTLAFQTKEFKDKALKPIKIEKEKNIWTFYWNGKPYYQVDIKQDKVLKMPSTEQKKEILSYYKELLKDPSLWKIDLNTGEEKKRDEKEKIYCIQKGIEPYDWINVEGVTDPRIVEPVPGGTRNGPGIFIIIDEGTYEMGADKPYFKEFFLHGKKFKGRYCFRLVSGLKETRKLMDWLYWKPDDQNPYVLSKRAIKEKWLPKEGSALPADLERRVPPNLCYWKKGLSTEEKLRRREEVAKFLLGKNKSFMVNKFLLTRRFWKGQEVIRKAEVSDYHLKFGKYQFHLDKNPILNKATGLIFSNDLEYFTPGKYPPKSKINPNKKIPVYVEIIDSGTYELLREEPKRIQVKFNGKKLKGLYYLLSTDGVMFQVIKQDSPKTFSKEFYFKLQDFKKEDKTILSSDIKFPYRFKTVAFSEGTWHDTFYPWEVIKEAAPKILNVPVVTYHIGPNDPILTEIGRVIDFELDEEKKRLIVDCELFDTTAGRDCAILLANKRIPAVSVRILEDSEFGECKKILEFPHIAFVREGEVQDAKICYDGVCPA